MNPMDEVEYSDLGLIGRDIFLAEFSDVLFYFEDAAHENLYEKLIAILCPEYLTNAVVCLGGKSECIKYANQKNDLGKPRIFVVDKDFDDILGLKKEVEGLVYLDRFCLENYLIDFPAILSVVIDRFALSGVNSHRDCADFDVFYARSVQRYIELTRLYLVARKYRLSIKTTKSPVEDFIRGASIADILPESYILAYREELLKVAQIEADWIAQDNILDDLLEKAFGDGDVEGDDIDKHLCGKHLLGIVKFYLAKALNIRIEEIPVVSLYMDILGRIAKIKDLFSQTNIEIIHSVERQRLAIAQR